MPQAFRLQRVVLLWLRRHPQLVRRGLLGLGGFALLTVILQLFYPAGRLLPFVEIQSQNMGGKTVAAADRQLKKNYTKASIDLKTEDASFKKSLEEIGVDVQTWNTSRSAARYTFGQRLIPFSSLYVMLQRDTPAQVRFDDERLDYFAEQVHKEGFVAAVNASVKVDGDKAKLVPAKPSKNYSAKKVTEALHGAQYAPVTTVRVAPETKQAERTNDEVKGLLAEAQRAVDTPLTLKLDKEEVGVDKGTIGSWLDFPEDAATKKLRLGLKGDAVKKYLHELGTQKKIYKAPGATKVQIIDGREVGRTAGQPGRGIDGDKTIALLHDAFKKGDKATLSVPIVDLPPTITYDRQYSNSDTGLTALLGELANSGISIAVMELGGRSGNAGGDKQYVAASTYKLFVSYALFKEIEAGRMGWGDPINGNTVQGCFEIMIVRSDNPCAKAFGDKIGWQNVENQMRALGLSQTELSPSLYTTAKDLALFLYKFENGTLVSASDRARLLDAMKRQIYRSGIPAGTGLPVANKPGFIGGYIHDPGIVYSSRGPYVLVIMTNGSSWSSIASAAKQVEAFLAR